MEKRYSEFLPTIASTDILPSELHEGTDWPASRGSSKPPQSTQEDHREVQLHNVSSVECIPHESCGHCDVHFKPQGSRRLTESPAMTATGSLTWQVERVIPEMPLVGYHLEDSRRDVHSTEFRSNVSLQGEFEWVDMWASTPEEPYELQQIHCSNEPSLKRLTQACSRFPRPPGVVYQRHDLADTYHDIDHDVYFENHRYCHVCPYRRGEFLNCPRCLTLLTPPVNLHHDSPVPEEYHASSSRSVEHSMFLEEVAQSGGQPLRGVYIRGTKPVQRFQKITWNSASKTHKPQQGEEHCSFDFPLELEERISKSMLDTIRAQKDQVDELRADIRDMRSRLAKFVATGKKAQEKSLAFIAAVKARKDEDI
ncbi:hypothetical protein MRX96_031312 [Rhipicephalus microplus]